jgi:hypothetical protein
LKYSAKREADETQKSDKVSLAAMLVVASVLMVLLIISTASDKWSPL